MATMQGMPELLHSHHSKGESMDGLTAYTICPPRVYLTENKILSVVTALSFTQLH